MSDKISDDKNPETKNNASDKDENDKGAKIDHCCSSVKRNPWLIENFNFSQNFLHLWCKYFFIKGH